MSYQSDMANPYDQCWFARDLIRIAKERDDMQAIPIMTDVPRCPVCKQPAHSAESNDLDQHAECATKQQREGHKVLADGIAPYNGWGATYEYPGQIEFRHDLATVVVFATPDYEHEGWVSVQVQDHEGSMVELPSRPSERRFDEGGEIPFPVRTSEALFAAVKPWLDLHQPKLHPAVVEVVKCMDRELEGAGGPEGEEYLRALYALIIECHRRRHVVLRAKQRDKHDAARANEDAPLGSIS